MVTGVTIDTSGAPGFSVPAGGLGTFTPTLVDTNGTGHGQVAWTFTVDNALVQGLDGSQQVNQVYTVQIDDGHGGLTSQNVTIDIAGIPDAPVIAGATSTGGVPSNGLSDTAASYLTADHNLINGLGGASSGNKESTLGPNDDGSSAAINLTSVFGNAGLDFFGTTFTSLYVNNNGNITFGEANWTSTPIK